VVQTTDTAIVRAGSEGPVDGGSGSHPGRADDLDLGRALDAMLAANRELRNQLERYDAMLLEGADKVRAGASISEALVMVPTLAARRASEAAMTAVFEARHQLRRATVYATLRDGMTIDAVAATLEVSAHMVCAIAAETPFRPDCPGGLGVDASGACRASGTGSCAC
jgi:hypothetical protein